MKTTIQLCVLMLAISGCTWVNENPAGKAVRITQFNQVFSCNKVGDVVVSVKHKVGFISRGKNKVANELTTLARNEAIKINADTLVAKGEPIEGKQEFQAFRCNA